MIARSRSCNSSTRDLNTTSRALCMLRTSASELASEGALSPPGSCAAAENEMRSKRRIGNTTFILQDLTQLSSRSLADEGERSDRFPSQLRPGPDERLPGPSTRCSRYPQLCDVPADVHASPNLPELGPCPRLHIRLYYRKALLQECAFAVVPGDSQAHIS